MLFGDSEQKKKQKEQRSREKEWKGKLTGAGMEKGAAGELAKIITEAQRSGESLQEGYKTSREHLERAQRKIELLLDEMTEEPERDVKKSLDSLIVDLDHVYHICSIREDDPDYGSTVKCLKTGIIGAWNAGCKDQHTYAAQRAGKYTGSVKGCCGMGSTGFFCTCILFDS